MGKICGIYILTFPNGKKYVGQSIDIMRRFRKYRINDASNQHLKNALIKYGWNSVKYDIREFETEYLDAMEQDLVYIMKTYDRCFGYNKHEGGDSNRVKSEDTLKRLSESHKKYKITEKHRENLSKACSGDLNGFKGKHHTEDNRKRMREIKLNNPFSKEHIKKMIDARYKKVYVVHLPWLNLVVDTLSIKQLAKEYDLCSSRLFKIIKYNKNYKNIQIDVYERNENEQ